MTISTTASRISHNGNGVTTGFAFPYRFFTSSDLVVVKVSSTGTDTTLVLNTDYTVTGADDDAGGTVTCSVAPASGERLVIYRDMSATQEVDYVTGDAFPAETHERALDRLTMLVQQIDDGLSRSMKVGETSTTTPDDLIDSINASVASAASSASDASDSADAAAVSATAASDSADAAAASAASIVYPISVANGGTGATTAANARANLGLVIGTDVLAPNGSGASLTGIKKIAQRVVLESTALGSTTAVIPMDDSIPQNTEGDLWLSQSFTPVNPASTICVRVFVPVFLSNSVASLSVIALFSSESTDAKAVAKMYNGSANPYDGVLTLGKTLTSWSGARTLTVRVGVGTGGALMYLNGRPTPLSLGRVETSYLEIIEVLP